MLIKNLVLIKMSLALLQQGGCLRRNIFHGKMKSKYYLIIVACMSVGLSACSQRHDVSGAQSDSPSQKASNYLQQFVHVGDTKSNLISMFGPPINEHTTELHQVSMTFLISAANHEAQVAHAAGFTVFCTNNIVTYWLPATSVP